MGSEKTDPSSVSSSGSDAGVVVTLDDEARDEIIRTKVTCPFLAIHHEDQASAFSPSGGR
jgi:hypothetical protein